MGLIGDICNVLAAMDATHIDLYEWQRANVTKPRLPNNPQWPAFANSVGSMTFTGIELAHAVVKADYLIVRNFALPSVGFLLQMDQIIEFGGNAGIRLRPGASSILSDVTQSSVVGRVGQGLSILFAREHDYAFVGHLASDPSLIAHLPISNEKRVADFLFEKTSSERMILESKATFSLDENKCSPVKTVLKQALEKQVDPWMGVVSPSPSKGYAVYSCLREVGNSTPSAIVFVDPPERKGVVQVEFPNNWVRRQNYAAWLRVMGLRDAANRLRVGGSGLLSDKGPSPVKFRRAQVHGRDFALLTSLDRPQDFPDTRFAVGIDLEALQMVSATIQGSSGALADFVPKPAPRFEGEPPLSILPDGTLFGLVKVAAMKGTAEVVL